MIHGIAVTWMDIASPLAVKGIKATFCSVSSVRETGPDGKHPTLGMALR
jgi:hypothetical protein